MSTDPRTELRDLLLSKAASGRVADVVDSLLRLFTNVRHGVRDLDVTTLGHPRQQIHRERYLVAEVFLGSEHVEGEPLGMYFTDGDDGQGDKRGEQSAGPGSVGIPGGNK